MINILSASNSLVSEFIKEMRDVNLQKDRMRFRKNAYRLGEIFAYEISKRLEWNNVEVTTPFGLAQANELKEQPVIASILRAGLPMHDGMLSFFDKADNAFISAYRKDNGRGGFDIKIEYVSNPDLENRVLILCDSMVATGMSMVKTYKELIAKGKPSHTHFVSIIASTQGLDYFRKNINTTDYTVWLGVLDEELTAKSFIVPGLGDAGDLSFGSKGFEEL
ncbi:MAG: uracil phosphoribosyltransferase [Bacteroidetes bacterium GWE2_29_8]|nr:MAG: uracil phosphoribosyltransferase [Bacteroidetes bacterium GWE2_29_8]